MFFYDDIVINKQFVNCIGKFAGFNSPLILDE